MEELLPRLSISSDGIVTKEFYCKHWAKISIPPLKMIQVTYNYTERFNIEYRGMSGGWLEIGVLQCVNHRRLLKLTVTSGGIIPYYKDRVTYLYNKNTVDNADLLISIVSSGDVNISNILNQEVIDLDDTYTQYEDV